MRMRPRGAGLGAGLGLVMAVAVLLAPGLLGAGWRPARPSAAAHPAAASAPAHLLLVIEENHEFGQVIGSRQAPFLNRLAAGGTLLTDYYAVGHPSLPNYLALIGGDTFGVRGDCTRCRVRAASLVDQLEAAGISWKAYYQDLPAPGITVMHAGAYTIEVDPFLYFDDVRASPARRHKVVPLAELDADLAANRLPRFAVVAPDLRHDMHSGPVAAADSFLRRLYERLAASPAGRDTRLVVTFDEGTSRAGIEGGPGGGRVATIVVGAGVPSGVRDDTPYDHYSLLRSIERLYGLPALRHAASPTVATIPAIAGPAASPAMATLRYQRRARPCDGGRDEGRATVARPGGAGHGAVPARRRLHRRQAVPCRRAGPASVHALGTAA
jgi:phosphatidylinositol-3-phosphatase